MTPSITGSTPKRLAICPRVSTADQEEYGTSLAEQEDKLRLLAQLHDYVVAPEHVYSGDESGRLPLARRAIVQRMLAAARAREFDAVAFYKLDRMARRLRCTLELWDLLDDLGIKVLIVDPMIDTSTAVGRLIRNVLGAVAEFEVDTTLERTTAGKKRKLARGEAWLTGVHYGYRYTKADRAAGTAGHISVHDAEADNIRRMYRRRELGISYERIALELTADDIPTPKGAGSWSYTTVRKIIANEAYMGTGQWGKREEVLSPRGKRSSRLRRDGRPTTPVTYPPIVSREQWVASNAHSACRVPAVRAGVEKYLLSGGLVRCAEHDLALCGSSNGSRRPVYRCQRNPGGRYPRRVSHCVDAAALEVAVWTEVIAFLADPARGRRGAAELLAQADRQLSALAAHRAGLEQALAALDGEAAELLRLLRRGKISPERIEASMAEVDEEARAVRARLERTRAEEMLARVEIPAAEDLRGVCADLAAGAVYATAAERRELLDLLQVRVLLRGHDYEISGIVPELSAAGTLDDGRSAFGVRYDVHPNAEKRTPNADARAQNSTGYSSAHTLHPRAFTLVGSLAA